MSMSTRERILAKLKNGRDNSPLPPPARPDVQAYYQTIEAIPEEARVERLRQLLEVAHADVIIAGSAEWPALAANYLNARGVKQLMSQPACPHAPRLQAAGLQARIGTFDSPIENLKSTLIDQVDAGLTEADSAIAATGTLVFRAAPQQPRSLSLVPPLHVALIRAENIHSHMISVANAEQWGDGLPTNLIMVSGPSKTSDIQQTLAYGAHGPKQMLVVIITPEQAP